ncbi:MAG: family 16 glycosylhydrolase [Bryobacteraceae bacterium]|jgi:uncharacterized protein (TIGR03437 family)
MLRPLWLALALALTGAGSAAAQSGWTLTWNDEFDGPSLDQTKWGYNLGAGGWGNQELEYYTNRPENVYVDGGMLVIKAIQEPYLGAQYTSGRILTKNKFSQAYGRFEARIKIPYGQGLWPAFWMMGSNSDTVGWPTCGEIDIMENIGKEPNIVHGTMHGPGYSGANGIGAVYSLPASQRFADDFHVFAIEWEPGVVRWYVDDQLYKTTTSSNIPAGTSWVFDHPFYVLLNVAVGGLWPGNPDATTQFPQVMRVDYVRVYQRATSAVPTVDPGGITNSASFLAGFAPGSWMTIWGRNLANTTRDWRADDILNGILPTQLDGVSVTVNGKPAYIAFVGSTQINAQAPDVGEGPVMVAVVNNGQRSELYAGQAEVYSPALFLWQNQYAVATDPDFNRIGKPGLYPGVIFTPAKPGHIIVLWGTGLGPTSPPVPSGQLVPPEPLFRLASDPSIWIGGVAAPYLSGSAVMTPTNAGVYQLALTVPDLADGDYPVVVEVAGHRTPDNAWLTIAR